MVTSFDIDNTLIPYSNEFEVEELGFIAKLLAAERLRKGTKSLFRSLESRGYEIWIYTTSYRSKLYLARTFIAHGLFPRKYINGKMNDLHLAQNNYAGSKNPKLFGIAIHVDDSEGLRMEGEKNDFHTIIISPENGNWVLEILAIIDAL